MTSLEDYRWCIHVVLPRLFNIIFVNILDCKITKYSGYRMIIGFLILQSVASIYGLMMHDELDISPIFCICLFTGLLQV